MVDNHSITRGNHDTRIQSRLDRSHPHPLAGTTTLTNPPADWPSPQRVVRHERKPVTPLTDLANPGFVALSFDNWEHGERTRMAQTEVAMRNIGNFHRHMWMNLKIRGSTSPIRIIWIYGTRTSHLTRRRTTSEAINSERLLVRSDR